MTYIAYIMKLIYSTILPCFNANIVLYCRKGCIICNWCFFQKLKPSMQWPIFTFLHCYLLWLLCQQHAFKTHESIFFLTVVHILAYPWPLQTPLFLIFVYSWRATIFSILVPLSFLIGSIRSDNATMVLNIVVGFPINLLPDTSTFPDFSRNSK